MKKTDKRIDMEGIVEEIAELKRAEAEKEAALQALRESEERYRIVADFTYDWEYWLDPAGNLLYVSPSCERITGWRPEELQADPGLLIAMIHPDDCRMMADHLQHPDSLEICQIEFRIITRNGEERWISHKCQPVYGDQGHSRGRRASNRDITLRKQAEIAARKSQEQLADVYQLAHIGIWHWDAATDTLTWSEELYRIFGLDPLLPAPSYAEHPNLYTKASWRLLKEAVNQTKKTGEPCQMELQLIRTDGTTRWVSAFGGATHDKDGQVTGLQGTLQDITLRKLAEEKLRKSEEEYRILFDNAIEAICVIQEGKVVFLNPALSTLTGYSAEEIPSGPFIDFVHPDDRKMVLDRHVRRINGENIIQRYSFRLIHKNGALIWVELNTVFINWQEKPATLNFLSDITLRVQIEEIQTFLAQASSGSPDEPFFQTLAKYLARKLDMDFVCIDRLEGDGLNATTVAVWCDGRFEDNVTYALKDTPCGDVVGKTVCSFPTGVCQFFPRDQVLQDLRAESYVGVTLWGHEGLPVGLIALISRRPLTNRELAEKTLQMVAVRAAGELERLEAEEATRKSEETYRALSEGLPDIVMRFDRNGRHLFASENVFELADLHAAQFIGKTHSELGFPEALCRFWEENIRTALESNEPLETEFTIYGKNGPVIFNWRLIPEHDAQGKVRSLLSISRDITNHRQAEQDYHTLFNKMLDGFALHEILCDEKGHPADYRFLAVNPAFEHMTGMKSEDIVGRTVLEVLPGTEQHWIETYGRVTLTGESVIFENYHSELNKHFEVMAFRPAPNQFACIFTDITGRKLAETSLKMSEEKFAKAFENSPMMMTISAIEDGKILDINKAFTQLSGFSREEAIGKTTVELGWINPDDRGRFIADLIKNGSINGLDLTAKAKDGRNIICLIYGQIINISNQQCLLIIGQDITDRRRAEEEKEKLQAQLTQAQKRESIGRLAGGVAHDFNNMLGVIIGRAEMALEETDPALPIHTDLAEIHKAAERSANLTRQLLAFARRQNIAPQVLDLNEVVEGMLKMLRRLIGEDIDLAWLPQTGLWPVNVDPSQVDQILANLCVNARDAIGGIGKMSIETANIALDEDFCAGHQGFIQGEYVRITVSDNGCGMDRETLDHIFEPFFTTKGVGKGTGLGLSTTYGAVKQSSGFINVYSEPGQGTTFTIYLPRHKGKTKQIENETRVQPAAKGNETILVAEDEPAMLKLTTNILKRQGYTVLAAITPFDAIRLARDYQGEIHLLITDVVMPDMNGRDLSEKLLSIYPLLHTLFMSGYTANIILDNVNTDKVRHFIQKPFTAKALAAKVRDVLDGIAGS